MINPPGASSHLHRLERPPNQSQHSWSFCPANPHFLGSRNDPPPSDKRHKGCVKVGFIAHFSFIYIFFSVLKSCAPLLHNYKFSPLHKRYWNRQIRSGLCSLQQFLHPVVVPSFLLSHSDQTNMKQLGLWQMVLKLTIFVTQNAMWFGMTACLYFHLHSELHIQIFSIFQCF